MTYDGNGNHSLPQGSIVETGDKVLPSQHNPPLQDISASLSMVMIRDGRAPMVGPLPMNNNPITGLAPGTSPTDAATVSQGVPIGASMEFAGSVAPATWMFEFGQALSRTTYSDLFAVIGTTFGAGDGSTTFNLPDCRGRVVAGKDDMGGASANRLTGTPGGVNGDNLGAAGGSQVHILTVAELANHNHTATVNDPGHTHQIPTQTIGGESGGGFSAVTPAGFSAPPGTTSGSFTGITVTVNSRGTDNAHNNVQPTLIKNKIIKVSL